MKRVALALYLAWSLSAAMSVAHAQSAPSAAGEVTIAQMLAAADAGDADAAYAAAAFILLGDVKAGPPALSANPAESERRAAKYLAAAVRQGHLAAQYLLGTLYLTGRSVEQDSAKAKSLFLEAAQAGNSDAQNALGQMLRKGVAGAKDETAAVAWFDKAASQGNLLALTNLGYMYSNGLGIARDAEKALQMTRRAAEGGVAEAQHNLGWMYHHGHGVAPNAPEAVAWYRQAADQGYGPSALNVGFIYAKGQAGGEIRDQLVEAVKWFAVAATSRERSIHDTAKKAISYVAERVPPDVMLDGGDAAQRWTLKRQMGVVNSAHRGN